MLARIAPPVLVTRACSLVASTVVTLGIAYFAITVLACPRSRAVARAVSAYAVIIAIVVAGALGTVRLGSAPASKADT